MPNLDYNTSIKFLFWISESQGESMENQEYLVDDCKKDKELFNSYLRALIIPIIFLIFIVVVFYVAQEERKEIYNAFINGEEIICDNFIVSKKLGFKFDKNNKYRVSDDKNSFILYNCISKKTE